MRKTLLTLAALLGILPLVSGQSIINGRVEGATSADKVYTAIFNAKGLPTPVDSARVGDDGRFTLKTNLSGTDVLIVTLPKEDKLAMGRGAFRGKLFGMFLEGNSGTYDFAADKSGNITISGGIYDDDKWAAVKKATLSMGPYEALQKAQEDFVIENPSHYAYSAYVVATRLRGGDITAEKAETAYANLDEPVRASRYGKILAQALDDARNSAPGMPAPAFTLTDKDGKALSLSDYRGKYLLLEFWGSWCGPCRATNPMLAQLYAKYKNKGFDIVSLACRETSEKNWLAAIAKDGMTWTQVNTSVQPNAATGREIMEEYNISYFPQSILIGPDGVIVDRGHAQDIMKEIDRIFSKK